MNLDEKQREAVEATEGAVCIVAGPGSGKTATIVARILYLIREKKIAPQHILALTFTNKAAREMRERLTAVLNANQSHTLHSTFHTPLLCTFHALGVDILNTHGALVGLPQPIAIATEAQQKKIMQDVVKAFPDWSVKDARSAVSAYKVSGEKDPPEAIAALSQQYQNKLTEAGLLDFDDVLVATLELFTKHEEVLQEYQDRFHYLMVDEYQDTNSIQEELLAFLAPPQNNLCVIGDPQQAIYGFRGARPEMITTFPDRYPRAQTIVLAHNYRSTQPIVRASTLLFDTDTIPHTTRSGNAKVRVVSTPDASAEARYIVQTIGGLLGGIDMVATDSSNHDEESIYDAGEIAVLFRVHVVGQFLQNAFTRAGIPYQRYGQQGFFEHSDIQRILEHLSTSVPDKRLSVHIAELVGVDEDTDESRMTRKDARLRELIHRARVYDALPPLEAVAALLQEAALEQAEKESTPLQSAVTLMSVHAAKGLEFPVVFVAGVEEGLFPLDTAQGTRSSDIEEERRLLYVAMTRAKEQLFLSHSASRTLFGETKNTVPSRFLDTLPPELVEHITITPKPKKEPSPQQSLF